jgi:hypothetical protein
MPKILPIIINDPELAEAMKHMGGGMGPAPPRHRGRQPLRHAHPVMRALGISANATHEDVVAVLDRLTRRNASMTALENEVGATGDACVVAVAELAKRAARVDQLSAELDASKVADIDREFAAIVAEAESLRTGGGAKLTPAMRNERKAAYARAKERGGAAAAREFVDDLVSYLVTAEVVIRAHHVHQPMAATGGLTFEGKAWHELSNIGRQKLYTSNHALYVTMRDAAGNTPYVPADRDR